MSNRVIREAYGKINLGLDVLGRREDGYHLVKMIMQTVGISDTLEMERFAMANSEDERVRLQVAYGQTAAGAPGDVPEGKENLICRAAERMMDAYGLSGGIRIRLTKRIPVAAGMAGGSTDAAAALMGIRELFDLTAADKELQQLALPLGADIPYCITGGTQLSEGIGEVLTPLDAMPDCCLIIVKPAISVSTGWVYRELDACGSIRHPDIDGQIDAIRRGDLRGMAERCGNVLEEVTAKEYPVIRRLEEFFLQRGALAARMTGSGPTVFAIYDDDKAGRAAYDDLSESEEFARYQRFLTKPVPGI